MTMILLHIITIVINVPLLQVNHSFPLIYHKHWPGVPERQSESGRVSGVCSVGMCCSQVVWGGQSLQLYGMQRQKSPKLYSFAHRNRTQDSCWWELHWPYSHELLKQNSWGVLRKTFCHSVSLQELGRWIIYAASDLFFIAYFKLIYFSMVNIWILKNQCFLHWILSSSKLFLFINQPLAAQLSGKTLPEILGLSVMTPGHRHQPLQYPARINIRWQCIHGCMDGWIVWVFCF